MQEEDNNPDSIERLFQEKAGEYQIPFRNEDWNRLEKRLDLHDMQLAYRRKFQLAVAALILIISTVGYFTVDHNMRLNQLTDQIQGVSPPESIISPPESIINESTDPTHQDNRDTFAQFSENELNEPHLTVESTPNRLEKLTLADRPEWAFQQPSGESHSREYQQSQWMANFQHIPVSPDNSPLVHPGDYIEIRLMIPTSILELSDLFSNLNDERTTAPFKGALYTLYTEHRNSHLAVGSVPVDGVQYPGSAEEKNSNLSVGIAYSPDFSRSDFSTPGNKTGYRFGMRGEYQITENLFFQTGLILSKVHYTASGQQYNPPNYWNSGNVPDETNAICMILDIPIGLKYNLFNFNNSRLFSTAALSSYFMLREEYRFNYSTENPYLQEYLKIENGSRHLLNHLNLSFGYEFDLSPNMTIRTEPFIHLPISGVGWGDARFYSMGGFVSLNLQMNTGRSHSSTRSNH